MASLSFIKQRPPSDSAAEIELDLTPMMSVFLILLPFLVSMAVLTHLSILEFSLPPNVGAGSGSSSEKPKLKLTVVMAPDFLAVTYGDKLLDSLPAAGGQYDYGQLMSRLAMHKQELTLDNELIVASRDQVRLKNIVTLMDRCKSVGFDKIGLSSATENPEGGM